MRKNNVERENTLSIYTDGASRGKPGLASYGFIFVKEGIQIH